MTVTYLPVTLEGEVQLNFQYIENFGLFMDPRPGVNITPAIGQAIEWDGVGWVPSSAAPQPGDLVYSMASTRVGAYPADGTAYTLSVHPELAALAANCPAWVSGGVLTMPNVAGRTVVGSGTGAGLTARTLGQVFGEETHLLTTAELAAHKHPLAVNSDTGVVSGNIYNATTPTSQTWGFSSTGPFGHSSPDDGLSGSAGSGTAHNNLQPSIVLNPFIIY